MILLWIIGSAVAAAVYVALAGILEIQISGSLAGGVYDLNNVIVGVSEPGVPYLQYASLAVLSTVLLMLILRKPSATGTRSRAAALAAFSVTTLVMIGWGLALQASAMAEAGGASQGLPEGAVGWILKGGSSVVVHAVALVAIIGTITAVLHMRANVERPSASAVDTRADAGERLV